MRHWGFILCLGSLGWWSCSATVSAPTGPNAETSSGIAVICSDYVSTSVALLDPLAATLTWPHVIHSGSRTPSSYTALSGDIALPTQAPQSGDVLLIDRYPNAVLTWLSPRTGEVTRQLSVGTGFAANPRDVLVRVDGRIVVTRNNPHPNPSAAQGADGGDDVIVLGPDGQLESRLEFTREDQTPGRPDRLLQVGSEIWVSLNRVSRDFTTYFEGRIGRMTIDEFGQLERVGEIALSELSNCSALATTGSTVAVACTGSFDLEKGNYDISESAIVVLDEKGLEVSRLQASDSRVGQSFGSAMVMDDQGRVVVQVYGDGGGQTDGVIRFDPETGEVTALYWSQESWTISAVSMAEDGVVVVGDGDAMDPKVCRLGAEVSCLSACTPSGLPPRAMGAYGL